MVILDDAVKQRALAAARSLAQWGAVRAIYVFGSYAEGRADKWSDLDVAAFMEGIDHWDLRQRAHAMARAQLDAGLDIEAHLFPASALEHPDPSTFAGHIQRHGICISKW